MKILILPLMSLLPFTAFALEYPEAVRGGVVETLHGKEVADPYRWMEDIDSEEVSVWVREQAQLADDFIKEVSGRDAVRDRLEKLQDYEKVSRPTRRGGRVFFSRNSGLQNQSVTYWHEEGGEPKVLLDPNAMSEDGTAALAGAALSDDGKYFAYGISQSGSDWKDWRVREVATGKDLPETVKWVKFSGVSWVPDNSGFYYSRYDAPKEGEELSSTNYFQKVYFHKLNTPQSEDKLIYERKDQKEWGFRASFSEDDQWMLLSIWKGAGGNNGLFYRKHGDEKLPFVELFKDFDAQYSFVGNDDSIFYLWTNRGAPKGKVVAIDLEKPEEANWRTVIAEGDDVLKGASLFGDFVAATYLSDAKSRVAIYDLKGDSKLVRDVKLPGVGSVRGFGGRRSDTETYYTFTGFTDPGTIYEYEIATGDTAIYRRPKTAFDPEDFTTRQVFVRSKDGTKVPVFLTHKKGLTMDGERPVYQYGYGGFDVSLSPGFSVANLGWMELGGIYAQASLRGGGEYGEAWHSAGKRLKKQNVFDDFIAVSEWLISEGITNPKKLAIGGGSNGGLLVGACLVQRPDLFGACVPAVGVLDMLRFQKFTIGWAWQDEYGFPEKDASEFEALLAYSPYHNVKKGTCYPPTMVFTGDHDDRVFPAHSFKFAAELQQAQGCENPILLRVDIKAGHGAGKPTSMALDEAADRWAFIAKSLGMELPGSK